jgi:hypothetical protein
MLLLNLEQSCWRSGDEMHLLGAKNGNCVRDGSLGGIQSIQGAADFASIPVQGFASLGFSHRILIDVD